MTITSSKNVGANYVGTNKFTFDRVFDIDTSQREVYEKAAKPIIEGVLKGFNGTVFAYGQTGSGKTHTMQGPDIEDLEQQGIVPRMVRTIFNRIDNMSDNVEYTIKVSMAEIYMERIRDLLDPSKVNLKIKENKQRGIYVHDLTEKYIASENDIYEIMKVGNENRMTAHTAMNDTSSRSHSIFIMNISQTNLEDLSSKSGNLYLVDLAGSEKVAKTNVRGTQLNEAKGINLSLSTLGKVIHALTDKKITHVPYRESKLTRILTESLGGNAKTCLIITCSPSPYNELETLSTLRFGTAARNIKNKPKINKEYTVAEMKLMLSKRDKLISVLKKRIIFLENFIKENGLEVPSDTVLAEFAKDFGIEVDKIMEEVEVEKEDEKEDVIEETKEEEYEDFEIPISSQLSDQEEFKIIDSGLDATAEEIYMDEEQKEKAENFLKMIESSSKNNQQEILDEFMNVQKQLKEEKEKYNAQVDLLSNMEEDTQIFQCKIKKLNELNEELLNYKEEAEQKINDLKEKTEDAQNDLEGKLYNLYRLKLNYSCIVKSAKLISIENEVAEVKKLYLSAKSKMARYEEKGTDILLGEAEENKEFRKEAIEGNELIREELRVLHDQIAERDQIISKIQQNPDLTGDIKAIIEASQQKILEEGKEIQARSENILFKKLLMEGGDPEEVKTDDSCYLTPSDIAKILEKQKEYKKKMAKNKKKINKLKKETNTLKAKITSLANVDQSDLEAIAEAMVNDRMEEVKENYDNERNKIMKDLVNRIDKVCELEMTLDIQQEEYAKLEFILNNGESATKKQIVEYEKSIESLSLMYHQSAGELSAMKVELQVSKKKMKSVNKKLSQIKDELKKKSEENKKLRKIAEKLRNAVENENFLQPRGTFSYTTGQARGKIVKKIKR